MYVWLPWWVLLQCKQGYNQVSAGCSLSVYSWPFTVVPNWLAVCHRPWCVYVCVCVYRLRNLLSLIRSTHSAW